jgi:hypothetical protein
MSVSFFKTPTSRYAGWNPPMAQRYLASHKGSVTWRLTKIENKAPQRIAGLCLRGMVRRRIELKTLTGRNNNDLCNLGSQNAAKSGAVGAPSVEHDPEPSRIIAAWSTLSDGVKREVLRLVGS